MSHTSNLPRLGEQIIEEGAATLEFHQFLEDMAIDSNFTVTTVPDATRYEGRLIYVSDETGGATMAFSDGTDWRRVQDRAIIS